MSGTYNSKNLIPLVRDAVSGNEKSLEELLKHVGPYIFKRALTLTGNIHDAEDIRQDVMIKIHNKIKKLKNPERYFGWQERIIRNMVTDYYRSRGREKKMSESIKAEKISKSAKSPERELSEKRNLSKVRESFKILAPKEQTAFFLREYEGMSPAEIARLMNVKESTARVLYSRAGKKIIEHLKKMKELGKI